MNDRSAIETGRWHGDFLTNRMTAFGRQPSTSIGWLLSIMFGRRKTAAAET